MHEGGRFIVRLRVCSLLRVRRQELVTARKRVRAWEPARVCAWERVRVCMCRARSRGRPVGGKRGAREIDGACERCTEKDANVEKPKGEYELLRGTRKTTEMLRAAGD
eukprot:6192251-Pleurochrysis_carterae.AAC.1